MHFKTVKVIATSDFLAALECTKFVFGRGSTPDPAGELTALPQIDPLWFNWAGGRENGRNKARDEGKELC